MLSNLCDRLFYKKNKKQKTKNKKQKKKCKFFYTLFRNMTNSDTSHNKAELMFKNVVCVVKIMELQELSKVIQTYSEAYVSSFI